MREKRELPPIWPDAARASLRAARLFLIVAALALAMAAARDGSIDWPKLARAAGRHCALLGASFTGLWLWEFWDRRTRRSRRREAGEVVQRVHWNRR